MSCASVSIWIMKIKFLLISLWISFASNAQSLEDNWYFDVSTGAAQTFGSMTKTNPGRLIYHGSWGLNLGFTKYSSEDQLLKGDLVGCQFGYLFHMNQADASDLGQISPTPASIKIHKSGQLLHGPYVRFEYTRAGKFAPYIGVGAHLLALRGAKFDVNFDPQDNYYGKLEYGTSSWGRVNACFSGFGGLRFVLPGDWSLSLNYELFLRDAWNAKYTIKAIPAAIDNPEEEFSFMLTQNGWNQRVELRLQLPLR
jgi:hypothetical protein